MSSFLLSPGITPEITDVFVVELPIALGLAYLWGRRYGFEVAIALNALALGAVKWVTDYFDLPDVLVALAALVGGALWLANLSGRLPESRLRRAGYAMIAPIFAVIGLAKLFDFYDPFDILLADAVILSAVALWVYRRSNSPFSGNTA